jgi:hypothetical protein
VNSSTDEISEAGRTTPEVELTEGIGSTPRLTEPEEAKNRASSHKAAADHTTSPDRTITDAKASGQTPITL